MKYSQNFKVSLNFIINNNNIRIIFYILEIIFKKYFLSIFLFNKIISIIGSTPLFISCQNGHVNLVKMLLTLRGGNSKLDINVIRKVRIFKNIFNFFCILICEINLKFELTKTFFIIPLL